MVFGADSAVECRCDLTEELHLVVPVLWAALREFRLQSECIVYVLKLIIYNCSSLRLELANFSWLHSCQSPELSWNLRSELGGSFGNRLLFGERKFFLLIFLSGGRCVSSSPRRLSSLVFFLLRRLIVHEPIPEGLPEHVLLVVLM